MEPKFSAERRRKLVVNVARLAALESDPDGLLDGVLSDLEQRIGKFKDDGGRGFGPLVSGGRGDRKRREKDFFFAGVYGALEERAPRLLEFLIDRPGWRAVRDTFVEDMRARFDLDVSELFEQGNTKAGAWRNERAPSEAANKMLEYLMRGKGDARVARRIWVESKKREYAWLARALRVGLKPGPSYLDHSPSPQYFAKHGRSKVDHVRAMMQDLWYLFGPLPALTFGPGMTLVEDGRTGRFRAFSPTGPMDSPFFSRLHRPPSDPATPPEPSPPQDQSAGKRSRSKE